MFQQILKRILAFRHYRNDQLGIIKRYLSEGENWKEHLLNSKEYILNALPKSKLESVAILGSGWLLDVPMDELLKRTNSLVLYDINHPNQLINKYKNNTRVKFVKADLTNNLIEGVNKSKTFKEFKILLNNLTPLDFLNDFSFVISLNLLNQLDILLCDLINQRFKVTNNDLIVIREKIQTLHIKSLPTGRSCLITDYEEINYNNSIGVFKEQRLIYTNLDNLTECKEWIWNFDTHGTYRQNKNTTFKVLAGKY